MNSVFFSLIFLITISFNIFGQNREFKWIQSADVSSKNYKLANKLYRSGKYEAGYFTIDYKTAKKLFKGRKSAIAVETILTSDLIQVPIWQSEAYKTKLDINQLSGVITSARKRKQLFKEAKSTAIKWEYIKLFKDKIEIRTRPKTFSVPFPGDSKDTIRNLVLIRKSKICRIQPFVNLDGNIYYSPFPDIEFQFSSHPQTITQSEIVESKYDTVSFRLYYNRNKTSLNEEEQISLEENLSMVDGKVELIEIVGYASIEGNLEINEKLYLTRAENIKKSIHTVLGSTMEIGVRAKENWSMFRHQISGTEQEFLKKYSKEQVRDYVNKHIDNPDIDLWLEDQRYVEVRIVSKSENIVQPVYDNPLDYYNNLMKKILHNGAKPNSVELKSLENAQTMSYQWYKMGKLALGDIKSMDIPNGPKYRMLAFNKLMFEFIAGQSEHSDSWLFDQLITLGNDRETTGDLKRAIRFNTQLMLYRAIESGGLEDLVDLNELGNKAYQQYIFRLIPTSRSKAKSRELEERIVMQYLPRFINEHKGSRLTDKEVEELYRFYYSFMISSYYVNFYPETRKQALRNLHGINKYFSEEKLASKEERIAIARLYMLYHKWEKALSLLQPLLADPGFAVYATQLSLSCKQYTLHYDDLIEEILASRFDLGYENWVAMFENPYILGPRYFDNAKVREYYFSR